MKKTIDTLLDILKPIFEEEGFLLEYDEKASTLRVDFSEKKEGVTISLSPILAKWERDGQKAIEEIVYYVKQTFQAKKQSIPIDVNEWKVIPVIRSTSFPTESNQGEKYIYFEHTAETNIFIALDQGNTYRLVTESDILHVGLSKEHLYERAMFALNGLPSSYREDSVAGNKFYFINTKDGYDASRMLDKKLMKSFSQKITGDMVVAVPHTDVCIVADIRNDIGYDVISQMAMGFFMKGTNPITALSFIYDNGEFEPLFILGKKKRT